MLSTLVKKYSLLVCYLLICIILNECWYVSHTYTYIHYHLSFQGKQEPQAKQQHIEKLNFRLLVEIKQFYKTFKTFQIIVTFVTYFYQYIPMQFMKDIKYFLNCKIIMKAWKSEATYFTIL